MTEQVSEQALTDIEVDVLIFGGGIAGLWTLARLQQTGYRAVLLEADALGAGQTRFAQGIIHGGTKYALTGKLTASSEAVAKMPSRWRACYEGRGELDLSEAELLSDAHYLWSTGSLTSRISGFFASKVMRSRSSPVADSGTDGTNGKALPELFQHNDFKGQFYKLDEPVFNTLSVIRALAEPRQQSILAIDADTLRVEKDNISVCSKQGVAYHFHYKKIIFMAGAGNEALLSAFGYHQPEMQRRPLKMVAIRGGLHDMIYAHCLGASVNPRITITSHRDKDGEIIWYMGGQLAEDGVNKDSVTLIEDAKKELAELIPWLDLSDSQWGVIEVDRAEIKQKGVTRPDSFSIVSDGDVITAWPTKMALSPALADALLDMLDDAAIRKNNENLLPDWAAVPYADFPWDNPHVWSQS